MKNQEHLPMARVYFGPTCGLPAVRVILPANAGIFTSGPHVGRPEIYM